ELEMAAEPSAGGTATLRPACRRRNRYPRTPGDRPAYPMEPIATPPHRGAWCCDEGGTGHRFQGPCLVPCFQLFFIEQDRAGRLFERQGAHPFRYRQHADRQLEWLAADQTSQEGTGAYRPRIAGCPDYH